ncbi:MAG TPA: beta-N-acetylhexosaminidase [Patescibacteria group bacterium]
MIKLLFIIGCLVLLCLTLLPSTKLVLAQQSSSHILTTKLTVQVFLQGIGNAGDYENPKSKGNMNPLHKYRNITIKIYDKNNKLVKIINDIVSFDSTSGSFIQTYDVKDLPDGKYSFLIKVKNFLSKQIIGWIAISSSSDNVLPPITLVAGDMIENNSISIVDYNILLSCFGSKALEGGCLNKQAADLNDDGYIDGVDYNLLLREMPATGGQKFIPLATPTLTPYPTFTPTPTILPTPTEIPGPQTSIQDIVPLPQSITSFGGRFALTKDAAIYVNSTDEITPIGQYLADKINPATGFKTKVIPTQTPPITYGNIYLSLVSDTSLGNEGYNLEVTQSGVTLTANKPAGLFNGIQTIRQLLPAAIDKSSVSNINWVMPTGKITDSPRYAWRGIMLDVVRHFFSVGDVERLIDEAAYFKINVIHLHLSDDQGWRLEIKSRPALASSNHYSQDQYKAIIAYAKARYITIVPEFDMPGHTSAARNAYPSLNCGYGDNLCPYNNYTYSFVSDVMSEVASLTPGQFIHIGGDESSLNTSAYDTFVNKVQDIISSKGKYMIGWDESSRANLKTSSAVEYWINGGYVNEAVNKGAKVVMAPVCHAYIDFSYAYGVPGGAGFVGSCPYLSVQNSYSWDPNSDIWKVTDKNILGVEVPLWTETVYSMNDIEYMVFPRAIAMAEVGWSSQNKRNWSDFKNRLGSLGSRLESIGIHFYHSPDINWR